MAYVKRHPTNNLKKSIAYIKKKSKTEDFLTYEHHLPSSDTDEIVTLMNATKENFNKTGGIQGHHFIQSFKSDEAVTLELAHQIGKEWSETFISDYEFVLTTHTDKDHIHNHIVINSVNVENGKKYVSNISERESIRRLSDEICKNHQLSIIQPRHTEKNKTYGEWKYQKEQVSWKDKIRNDIDDSISQSPDYKTFIEQMLLKNYTLRYGDAYIYNSFEHFDIGKRVRGKTLGDGYTETAIKERVLHKELEPKKDHAFFEAYYFLTTVPQKEIVQTDIDLSILEARSYTDFIAHMEAKGYSLRHGDTYKHNSFRHQNMKQSVRGKTIGKGYTETSIKNRIEKNNTLIKQGIDKKRIDLEAHSVFSKRYINNKYTYLKPATLHPLSDAQKATIQNNRQLLKDNQLISFFKQHNIQEIPEYLAFKKETEQHIRDTVTALNALGLKHKELMAVYTDDPSPELKEKMIVNAKEYEAIKKGYTEFNKVRAEFRFLDRYLLDKQKEVENKHVKAKEKERDNHDPSR